MHTGRGLPLLLLFFLTSLVVGQSTIPPANQCAVPKMDQDFCNSFHSLCLATPNKLCLAQSISQCIEETRLPYNILLTTIEYLREFIRRITIAVNTPAPTPAPTSPATTRKPIVPYPTPPPPPPPPPPITSLRPVTPPPPPTRPPTTTVRPGTSILQTTAATGIGVTIQINTGSGFIDFIIELLYSFDNKQINTALFEDLHNNGLYLSIRHDYAVNLQMSSADVEYLALKIEYLVLAFSQYDIKQLNAVAQLKYLLSTNRVFYYWLSTTVDNIYTNLGSSVDEIITKPFDEHTTSVNVNYTIFITSYYTRRHVYQCLSTASPAICQRYCTNSYGGNWIGIQARERSKEALQNFNRPRADYAAGFGDWEKGYWMGLECVYEITNRGRFELLVELANANGETAVAHYADFSIGGSEDGYTLRLGAWVLIELIHKLWIWQSRW